MEPETEPGAAPAAAPRHDDGNLPRSLSQGVGLLRSGGRRATLSYAAFYSVAAARCSTGGAKGAAAADDDAKAARLQKRLRDRRAAATEGELDLAMFCKTLLYELPPLIVGALFCTLIDGYQAAQSRFIAPDTNPKGLFGYLFITFLTSLPFIACAMAFTLDNSAKEWSLVEPLQLMVYYTLWKVTLSAKHAVAGSLHAHGLYGLNSPRFIAAERMSRIQFSCWVQGNDNQPGAVMEELYTACLRQDCDLSRLEFDVGGPAAARDIVRTVKQWKVLAATSLNCPRADPTPPWHPAHPSHHNQQFMHLRTGATAPKSPSKGGSPAAQNAADTVAPLPSSTSRYAVAADVEAGEKEGAAVAAGERALPRCPVSKYAEDDGFCLFDVFFKSTNDPDSPEMQRLVEQGKVPATYLCFLVGVQNWRALPMGKIMGVTMSTVLLMVFLPNICRALLAGKAAFGQSENGKLVLGFMCAATFFPVMLLFSYLVNCSVEMGFRHRASTFMRNILLPEGATIVNPMDAKADPMHVHISLSRACNVVSWGAVRELMHGASFCPFMHSKANAYVACSFGAAIGVSSIASFGALVIGTEEAGVEVSLPGVIKSLCFSLALSIYVLLAYRVNFSTRYQRQEIAKARLGTLAEINELEKRGDLDAAHIAQLAELRNASELLQVVDKQTTVSDHANPVRAMGLVADPAVLSIIVSILIATLYVEIQKVMVSLLPPSVGGGGAAAAGNATVGSG